jgi:hypothetical protein
MGVFTVVSIVCQGQAGPTAIKPRRQVEAVASPATRSLWPTASVHEAPWNGRYGYTRIDDYCCLSSAATTAASRRRLRTVSKWSAPRRVSRM